MNQKDFCSLFASLNQAVEILHSNRTPDSEFVAAFDTLKQARAMVTRVMSQQKAPAASGCEPELAAA